MSQSTKGAISIPSVALARMAAALADERIKTTHPGYGGIHMVRGVVGILPDRKPMSRWDVHNGDYPASAEYYRIIDRLTRGEKP